MTYWADAAAGALDAQAGWMQTVISDLQTATAPMGELAWCAKDDGRQKSLLGFPAVARGPRFLLSVPLIVAAIAARCLSSIAISPRTAPWPRAFRLTLE